MGTIFANRIVVGDWTMERVPQTYRAATIEALRAKTAAGEITEERLGELIGNVAE